MLWQPEKRPVFSAVKQKEIGTITFSAWNYKKDQQRWELLLTNLFFFVNLPFLFVKPSVKYILHLKINWHEKNYKKLGLPISRDGSVFIDYKRVQD